MTTFRTVFKNPITLTDEDVLSYQFTENGEVRVFLNGEKLPAEYEINGEKTHEIRK